MARHAKPNRPAARREAAASNEAEAGGMPAMGQPVATEATRAMLNASLNASLNMLHFIEQLHQMQQQTLQNMDEALSTAVSETSQGNGLQDLLNSQLSLVAEQFSRNAKLSTELFTQLLDAESQWMEQAQSNVATLTQGLLPNGSADGMGEPDGEATAATPLAMMGTAQTALAQMTKFWVDAVSQRGGSQPSQ